MASDQDRRDFYSQIADRYDETVLGPIRYEAYSRIPKRLLKLHGKPKGRVLDLGCGTGLGSLVFFEAGFDVVGIDYSIGMIEVAGKRPYKELFCQSIEDVLPVEDAWFDIVTALGVTEFVKDPTGLMNQIANKLASNGLCALTLPKPTDAAPDLGIQTYDLAQFLKHVDATQFKVLETEEFYGWESGHLSKLVGKEGDPHHKVDYCALYLRRN